MQELAEVVQRPHDQKKDIWALISTLRTMPGQRLPHFPHPTPRHMGVPPHFSWPAQNRENP